MSHLKKGETPIHDRIRAVFALSRAPISVPQLMKICGSSQSGIDKALLQLVRAGEVRRNLGLRHHRPTTFEPTEELQQPGEILAIDRQEDPPNIPGARVIRFTDPRPSSHDAMYANRSVAWSRPAGAPC